MNFVLHSEHKSQTNGPDFMETHTYKDLHNVLKDWIMESFYLDLSGGPMVKALVFHHQLVLQPCFCFLSCKNIPVKKI